MSRESRIVDQMDLLGIKDVSTPRQAKNGTVVWRLPIKYSTHPKFIEVASFKTGYVRNQNGGYSNYQLNKRCDSEPEYYNINPPNKEPLYRKFTTRSCVLIPNELDRLEYLIAYCLKNYYIKLANQVVEGKYVSKWKHEYEVERAFMAKKVNTIEDLQEKLANYYTRIKELESDVHNLENKLATIERIANDRNKWNG